MSRFEKDHSSPNLEVTAALPVVASFLPLYKNLLRILQLCHQYSQTMGVTYERVLPMKLTAGQIKPVWLGGSFQ